MASDTYGAILLTTANDVGAMLQKKMATPSETYAPAVWAETINLLGKLPEATVSGSIVTFSDGADDVPLKSCEVALPPSLDGYSSVDVVNTGKNLLVNNGVDISGSGLSFVVNSDKSVTISGVATANAFFTFFENVLFKASSYMIRGSGNSNVQIIVRRGTASGSNIRTASTSDIAWNLAEDTLCACVIRVASGTDLTTPLTVYPQIEVGSSLSDYETAISTTQTASLGRMIYGGTPDVVKGEGTETHGKKVFDGTEGTGGTPSWTMISVTQGTMFRITVSDKATTSATNTLCSYYTPVAQAQRADGTVSGAGTNVDIIDNRFSSVDAFKAWLAENPVTLVYEIATPTDFTFEPVEINSRLGANTMWSDGDMKVVYRRDIDLALQALSGSRGLMMARPPAEAETEETDPEDETTETIEETPEDMEK